MAEGLSSSGACSACAYRVTTRCTCRLAWLQRQADIAELAR